MQVDWFQRAFFLLISWVWNPCTALRPETGTHTCLGGWGKVHFRETHCYLLSFFSSLTVFAQSLHPCFRQPLFDPAIFSVWCTIIHPSLPPLLLTLWLFCSSRSRLLLCHHRFHSHSFFVSRSSLKSLSFSRLCSVMMFVSNPRCLCSVILLSLSLAINSSLVGWMC